LEAIQPVFSRDALPDMHAIRNCLPKKLWTFFDEVLLMDVVVPAAFGQAWPVGGEPGLLAEEAVHACALHG
jgi:hypothetical protein